MWKNLQSKQLKKKIDNSSDTGSSRRFRRIISETPSISLVKGCSDQREILSDATDQNFNSKSIEDDVAERENRVNSSDTVYLGLR